MKYEAILRAVQATPWAILPEKFSEILEFLTLKAQGVDFTLEEIEAKAPQGRGQGELVVQGNSAVIPVHGTIVNRGSWIGQSSGLTSLDGIRTQLRAAMNDEDVKSVVLDIDSPGGTAEGMSEIVSEIRNMRTIKPITASVNTLAASAGYNIAAAANQIHVTPSGHLGSIGVFSAHREISKMLDNEGVKMTLVHAGKHKIEGNPFEPLSKAAREQIQGRVDEYYSQFLDDVAAGRGLPRETVEKFGTGRIYNAKKAVELGMADKVQTMEQSVIGANVAATIDAGNAITTKREMESFLRDAGFSKERATGIASHGFEREAGAQTENHEREAGGDLSQAVLRFFEERLNQ